MRRCVAVTVLSEVEICPVKPCLPEFSQQTVCIPAHEIQRFRTFHDNADDHVTLGMMDGQFDAAKFLGRKLDLDGAVGKSTRGINDLNMRRANWVTFGQGLVDSAKRIGLLCCGFFDWQDRSGRVGIGQ